MIFGSMRHRKGESERDGESFYSSERENVGVDDANESSAFAESALRHVKEEERAEPSKSKGVVEAGKSDSPISKRRWPMQSRDRAERVGRERLA